MHIQHQAAMTRLAQQIVGLAAMMGLMIKEMKQQQFEGILKGTALVIDVADRPGQGTWPYAGREGLDSRIFRPARRAKIGKIPIKLGVEAS